MSYLITQFIYLKEGKEAAFIEFESLAIPLIKKYNGTLLLRIRPTESQFIEGSLEVPFEIHLVEFPSENIFNSFLKDESRKMFLHLKEDSIKSLIMTKGVSL